MAHIGVITPPVSGHLHPFGALGRALIKRGHRVTVFQHVDVESKVRAEGLEFIKASDLPNGGLLDSFTQISQLKGMAALRFTVEAIKGATEAMCRVGPDVIKQAGVDLLLVDQTEPVGAALAEYLKVPFVTVCNALTFNREAAIPPPFTPWGFDQTPWGKLRNRCGYAVWDWITNPINDVIKRYRRKWNLTAYRNPDNAYSLLAQFSQQTAAFDFPRKRLPAHFHYLGPFRDETDQQIPFPWERLDGRPLIYASLGTLQNRSVEIFQLIARACQGMNVQLVISHGNGLSEAMVKTLAGSPLVVSYAPQRALLAKARLTVSHAGLNTVLDSMSQGAPVVAIPLTYEQPAIAARLKWTGAGEVIPFKHLTAERLRSTIEKTLQSEMARKAAAQIAQSIKQAGGVQRAADILEALNF